MDMEVSIPPYPVLTVHAQPPSAMDTKVRRVLDKQFRAAGWSAKRVEWMSPTTSPSASGPVLHVSCEGSATARELVLVMRSASRTSLPGPGQLFPPGRSALTRGEPTGYCAWFGIAEPPRRTWSRASWDWFLSLNPIYLRDADSGPSATAEFRR